MHELSIAMSIVELSEEEALRRGGLRITGVHLRIGVLAGVVKDALLSSFDLARENTLLANSRLHIEEVPGVIYCANCDAPRPIRAPEWFRCSECGAVFSEILQGQELELVSLETEP